MDASQSALDSLRTVEFRETLKGYHRDDVDEYLEKAAVEAEGLQEQLRQGGERLRQAGERISQLEAELEHQPAPAPRRAGRPRRHPAADPAAGPEVRRRDQGRLRGPGGQDPLRRRRPGPDGGVGRRDQGRPDRRRVGASPPRGDQPAGGHPGAALGGRGDHGPPSRGGAQPPPLRPVRGHQVGGRERPAGLHPGRPPRRRCRPVGAPAQPSPGARPTSPEPSTGGQPGRSPGSTGTSEAPPARPADGTVRSMTATSTPPPS